MSRLLLILNLFICVFLIGSCATKQMLMIRRAEDSSPSFNSTQTNGLNRYESIIRLVDPQGNFYCTGFVVDGNYALTARHCVVDMIGSLKDEDIHIYSSYSYYTGITAKAVAADGYRDVAFLRGDFKNFEPQRTDFHGSHVPRGFKMISCGFPSGMLPKFCTELQHTGNVYFQYRTNGGPIYKGMSGGPVLSEDGWAIGVNSSVNEDSVIIGPIVGILESVGLN